MFLILILSFMFSDQVLAVANTESLSAQVIELRKEVELLNDEYKTEREKVLNEIKALSIQKAELASNIRNEEVRKKQVDDKISQLKKEMSQDSFESAELKPVVLKTFDSFQNYIIHSLPFKGKERKLALTGLRERLDKKEISVTKAANQLWAMIEDEKRLARETSLHKQTIPLGDKMILAEVVKLGMLFLFFKSEEGEVGIAEKKGQEWVFQTFKDESQQARLLSFMESLKKQIRHGYFEVPTRVRL